jgi:hypothetical protein
MTETPGNWQCALCSAKGHADDPGAAYEAHYRETHWDGRK